MSISWRIVRQQDCVYGLAFYNLHCIISSYAGMSWNFQTGLLETSVIFYDWSTAGVMLLFMTWVSISYPLNNHNERLWVQSPFEFLYLNLSRHSRRLYHHSDVLTDDHIMVCFRSDLFKEFLPLSRAIRFSIIRCLSSYIGHCHLTKFVSNLKTTNFKDIYLDFNSDWRPNCWVTDLGEMDY